MRIKISIILCIIITMLAHAKALAYPFDSYTISYNEEVLLSPQPAVISRVITGSDVGVGNFSSPSIIRISKNGDIYIGDTGNNRVLCFSSDWQLKFEIASFEINGEPDSLAGPQGVYIDDDGIIFIADTSNNRIISFDEKGRYLKTFPEPESDILPDNFVYIPLNLVVDSMKNMYVISQNINRGLMEFDSDGAFRGYFGASRVTPTALQVLMKRFSTKEQRERMGSIVPTEYNGIAIDNEGFIYATTAALAEELIQEAIRSRTKDERGAPIRKFNAGGIDILPRNGFFAPVGDVVFKPGSSDTRGLKGPSRLVDITVNSEGFYAVLDTTYGRIFKYDLQGNMLYQFGGRSETFGGFRNAVSIAESDDEYMIVDRLKGSVVVYRKTEYGMILEKAVEAYMNGEYEKSMDLWESALEMNGNLDIAYNSIGMIAMRRKDYKGAIRYFKLGQNREMYSKAFERYRSELITKYFTPAFIAFSILFVIIMGIVLVIKLKRKFNMIIQLHKEKEVLHR